MSNHCNFSVQDHNTCNDMEAWWTVITSIYNFLSASTNFAQTLDRKYASSYNPTVLHSSHLLREAPYTQNETTVEDFPWFLQLLNNDTKNVEIYSHDQIISDEQVRYYCNLHPEIIPLAKSYDEKNVPTEQSNNSSEFSISSNSNDELESTYIGEDLCSLHTSEQPTTQSYIENKVEALRSLTTEKENSVLVENTNGSIMDNQNIKQNREEAIESLPPEDSCYLQDYSHSEQTINSLDSHSSYKSYDRLDQIPTVIQDQQCPLLEGKPNYKNENNNEISGRSGSCADDDFNKIEETQNSTNTDQTVSVESFTSAKTDNDNDNERINHSQSERMHFFPKSEPKKCSICQRLRYCHERIRSTITELNLESGGTDIKSIAFGNKFPRNISGIHRCNTTKHASEVVPKNIDELKKQLNSIKSKPCENSTEIINKYISGTDKITENMIGEDLSKNVNFTVLTANISYRDHQYDTIKKHSRVNKRFASVESVVRKLIYGSRKNNTKEKGTSKITGNNKPRTLGNVGELKTVRTPNTQSKRVENSVGTNYFVEKISSSTKIENVVTPETFRNEQEIIKDQSNRNKYTIRKSVRLPKSLNQGLNPTVMKIMPNGGKKVESVGPRGVVPKPVIFKPVIFKQYSKPAENPKKNRFDSCVGTELKEKRIPISKPKKQ